MKNLSVYICIIVALFCLNAHCGTLEFQEAWPNIDDIFFPVDMDSVNNEVYVTSIFGQVFRFANDDAVQSYDVFFDISSAAGVSFFTNAFSGGDEGLTSFEFHPLYPTVPKFYIFYTSSAVNIQITAFSVVDGAVDYNSADVLLNIPKPEAKIIEGYYGILYEAYLGGDLRFHTENQNGNGNGGNGNDFHNLYISVGYGNDDSAAQNLNSYLGKILRITPRLTSTGYDVPSANPLNLNGKNEIFARGLRNPRRMYFSDSPDYLYCGDVGVAWDEINVIEKAKNYGWEQFEGCSSSPNSLFTYPIHAYTDEFAPHAITMGPYYDGPIKAIRGRMLYADLYSGQVYAIQSSSVKENCGNTPFTVATAPALISAFVVINDVVYVANVYGAYFGVPLFYRLVEV